MELSLMYDKYLTIIYILFGAKENTKEKKASYLQVYMDS